MPHRILYPTAISIHQHDPLTEVVAELLSVLTFPDQVLNGPVDVTDDNERWCERRSVEVLVDQVVAVESPHLLRILLHPFKCVTETAT